MALFLSIQRDTLIHQQRCVHRHQEQFLSRRISIVTGIPDVQRYPGLRQQPKYPHPSVIIEDKVEQSIERRNIDEHIVWQKAIKGAHICSAHSAYDQQQGHRYWHSQVDWERKTEGLNLDFTREFGEYVKYPGSDGVKKEYEKY